MRIVVLGAGAVGAYYGGQLARSGHAVTCFARGANLAAMREHGLEIRTPEGAFRPHLAATDRIDELGPAEYAILAVKSYSLSAITPSSDGWPSRVPRSCPSSTEWRPPSSCGRWACRAQQSSAA